MRIGSAPGVQNHKIFQIPHRLQQLDSQTREGRYGQFAAVGRIFPVFSLISPMTQRLSLWEIHVNYRFVASQACEEGDGSLFFSLLTGN